MGKPTWTCPNAVLKWNANETTKEGRYKMEMKLKMEMKMKMKKIKGKYDWDSLSGRRWPIEIGRHLNNWSVGHSTKSPEDTKILLQILNKFSLLFGELPIVNGFDIASPWKSVTNCLCFSKGKEKGDRKESRAGKFNRSHKF